MALKDWKKEFERKDEIGYHKSNTNFGIGIIYFSKTAKWIVRYVNDKHLIYEDLKSFKTKEQALTYAKSYMKKH